METTKEELIIKETWSKLWAKKQHQTIDEWDTLSEMILETLLKECGQAMTLVEAGCGTGRISRELFMRGMDVTCLDISPEALELAKKQIGIRSHDEKSANYLLGSILDMPKTDRFDVVWNSGVLEHFSPTDQMKSLSEFGLCLSGKKGKIIIFTPYARSFLYRIGKFILEKSGRWPFGREIPVTTLKTVTPPALKLEREYTMSFLPLFFDAHKWVPGTKLFCRTVYSTLKFLLGKKTLIAIDRMFSSIFGGYLLVSVFSQIDEE